MLKIKEEEKKKKEALLTTKEYIPEYDAPTGERRIKSFVDSAWSIYLVNQGEIIENFGEEVVKPIEDQPKILKSELVRETNLRDGSLDEARVRIAREVRLDSSPNLNNDQKLSAYKKAIDLTLKILGETPPVRVREQVTTKTVQQEDIERVYNQKLDYLIKLLLTPLS